MKKDVKDSKETKDHAYLARVFVSLKPTVNDPEGTTIAGALGSLGFEGVEKVRAGKYFQLTVRAKDERKAGKQVDKMCARLLANPVIETYSYEVAETKG
jgi:phosphoribosylformylglycinamidine synthase subunit PurS